MPEAKFVKSVFDISSLPELVLSEVILAGRSNVGKSTFINSFMNRKIALTSSTPGKTRSINYYDVDGKYYLVDLPGFGYSKAGKEVSDKWKKLLMAFFEKERGERLILHIIDSRHKPTPLDELFRDLVSHYPYHYAAVLNKVDKLNRSEYVRTLKEIKNFKPGLELHKNLFPYSAITKSGKKEVSSLINSFVK